MRRNTVSVTSSIGARAVIGRARRCQKELMGTRNVAGPVAQDQGRGRAGGAGGGTGGGAQAAGAGRLAGGAAPVYYRGETGRGLVSARSSGPAGHGRGIRSLPIRELYRRRPLRAGGDRQGRGLRAPGRVDHGPQGPGARGAQLAPAGAPQESLRRPARAAARPSTTSTAPPHGSASAASSGTSRRSTRSPIA